MRIYTSVGSVIIGGLSDLLNSRAVASMLFLVLSVPSVSVTHSTMCTAVCYPVPYEHESFCLL